MRILLSSALALCGVIALPILLYMTEDAPRQAAAGEARARRIAVSLPRREMPEMRGFEALLALTALQAEAKQSGRPAQ